MRKRDGGQGQQHLLVPLTPKFDQARIAEMLHPDNPEGVVVENTALLQEMGLLKITVKPPESHSEKPQTVYVTAQP